jgi:hypothetical protein
VRVDDDSLDDDLFLYSALAIRGLFLSRRRAGHDGGEQGDR